MCERVNDASDNLKKQKLGKEKWNLIYIPEIEKGIRCWAGSKRLIPI